MVNLILPESGWWYFGTNMARATILILLAAATGFAASKERAWQNGHLLDRNNNKYLTPVRQAQDITAPAPAIGGLFDSSANHSTTPTVYDDYVIEGSDAVYEAEIGHLPSAKTARLSPLGPVKFAVDKNKLWLVDNDGKEYEARILRLVRKQDVVAAKQEPKQAPAPVAAAAPKPVHELPPEAHLRPALKDRSWQGGRLLSASANKYFTNATYTSDTDGGSWNFVEQTDGRYTIKGNSSGSSSFVFDNYLIESEYCVYLVQRARPKSSEPVRLDGTKPLKFAVEKNKLWVLDGEGTEYETKILKLIQKDAAAEPVKQTASR